MELLRAPESQEVLSELLTDRFCVYQNTNDVIQTRRSRRSGFSEPSLVSCHAHLTGISCGEIIDINILQHTHSHTVCISFALFIQSTLYRWQGFTFCLFLFTPTFPEKFAKTNRRVKPSWKTGTMALDRNFHTVAFGESEAVNDGMVLELGFSQQDSGYMSFSSRVAAEHAVEPLKSSTGMFYREKT